MRPEGIEDENTIVVVVGVVYVADDVLTQWLQLAIYGHRSIMNAVVIVGGDVLMFREPL